MSSREQEMKQPSYNIAPNNRILSDRTLTIQEVSQEAVPQQVGKFNAEAKMLRLKSSSYGHALDHCIDDLYQKKIPMPNNRNVELEIQNILFDQIKFGQIATAITWKCRWRHYNCIEEKKNSLAW